MSVFFYCFSSQEFEDYRDADDAVYELNGKELLGERYAKKCVVAAWIVPSILLLWFPRAIVRHLPTQTDSVSAHSFMRTQKIQTRRYVVFNT